MKILRLASLAQDDNSFSFIPSLLFKQQFVWLVGVFCMLYLKKIPLPWEMEAEGDLSACQNLGFDDTGGGTENSQQLF